MIVSAPCGKWSVSADVPSSWFVDMKPVPSLFSPRQLFSACNRQVAKVEEGASQPRPRTQDLAADAILIWAYFQRPGDPQPDVVHPQPDYGPFISGSLSLRRVETFPASDAREWSGGDFQWQRCGFELEDIAVTIWIWRGVEASHEDVSVAEAILKSVAVA